MPEVVRRSCRDVITAVTYLTMAEALKLAARTYTQDVHKLSCRAG